MIFAGVAAIFALQLVANETSGGPRGPCVTHPTAPLGPERGRSSLAVGKVCVWERSKGDHFFVRNNDVDLF